MTTRNFHIAWCAARDWRGRAVRAYAATLVSDAEARTRFWRSEDDLDRLWHTATAAMPRRPGCVARQHIATADPALAEAIERHDAP